MLLAILVFFLGAGAILGGYAAWTLLPGMMERRRLSQRLADLSTPKDFASNEALVTRPAEGPLPVVDRLVARTAAGSWLSSLIAQSGTQTTSSAVVVMTVAMALASALVVGVFSRVWFMAPIAAVAGGAGPIVFLLHRRSARMRRFEEMFPEALDLLSRALRAGHAFQTAMGMAADELKGPVGPEFKVTFDQQNFGLPLRDALRQMTDRVPILDVRFFVTAVLIQRETGGNLAEILDNLAHVVRERFKIRRQIRTHTAHGRFTAFVLLSLPAALAIILMMLNPDHMDPLFSHRTGQNMLLAAVVMQIIGFFWIRQIIRIEV